MSCCAAVTHTVVPQKKSVASLQHSKLDLLHLLCYFWSGVAFQQHHAWLGASPSLIPYSSHSRSLGPPRNPLNLFEPLEAFEPLWTPWRPLNLIEGHWRLRSPLNPLTRSARSHFSDSPLRVLCFRVSQYTHWSHYSTTVYLVTNLAWSNPPTGAPRVIVFT